MTSLTYGPLLDDEQAEALSAVNADMAAGEAEWSGGATYLYVLEQDFVYTPTVTVPHGVYIRTVEWKTVLAFPVLDGDYETYLEMLEEQYVSETDGYDR